MNVQELYGHWQTTWSDIQNHVVTLHDHAAGTILELGTRFGVSTAALLAGVERHGGAVWSVDIDPGCAALFADHPQWHFVHADSLDKAALAARGLPAVLDVLFIDTLHTYEQTLAELELWGPAVRSGGGVIVLHDADTDLYPGVPQAMAAYCRPRGLAWTIRPGSYGLGVIEV